MHCRTIGRPRKCVHSCTKKNQVPVPARFEPGEKRQDFGAEGFSVSVAELRTFGVEDFSTIYLSSCLSWLLALIYNLFPVLPPYGTSEPFVFQLSFFHCPNSIFQGLITDFIYFFTALGLENNFLSCVNASFKARLIRLQ